MPVKTKSVLHASCRELREEGGAGGKGGHKGHRNTQKHTDHTEHTEHTERTEQTKGTNHVTHFDSTAQPSTAQHKTKPQTHKAKQDIRAAHQTTDHSKEKHKPPTNHHEPQEVLRFKKPLWSFSVLVVCLACFHFLFPFLILCVGLARSAGPKVFFF